MFWGAYNKKINADNVFQGQTIHNQLLWHGLWFLGLQIFFFGYK